MERVILACGALYLTVMNGLVKVLAGRKSARKELANAAPPFLPLELIKTSVVEFVSLAARHKDRLSSVFGVGFLKDI